MCGIDQSTRFAFSLASLVVEVVLSCTNDLWDRVDVSKVWVYLSLGYCMITSRSSGYEE